MEKIEKIEKSELPEKSILEKIRKIEIRTRRLVNDVMAGEYQSAFKGHGMAFDSVREYYEGDDIRSIDWNVTARAGHPYIKTFIEERELTVFFLVDISASQGFTSQEKTKKDVAVELCAVLAFNAIKNNDRVGLILFSDQVELFVPPKKGKIHALRIIRELLYYKPKHNKTDLKKALDYLNRIARKSVVAFVLSDFIDQGFEKTLKITAKKHDLVAVEVVDPREFSIPEMGLVEFQDTETLERVVIDTSDPQWREAVLQQQTQLQEEKKHLFSKLKIDTLHVQTDKPFDHDLVEFFLKRGLR